MARKKTESSTADRPLTITQLCQRIQRLLEGEIGHATVEGEISNLRRPSSGHAYFVLKDANAALNAVCFRSTLGRLKVDLEDGKKIEVSGNVTAYTARSEYQIVVTSAREAGVGDLMKQFIELRDKLLEEGLFEQDRKKPLPSLPRVIGIATSSTGAALRDMLTVLSRRAGGLEIIVAPCAVQGDAAPGEIVRAIRRLDKLGRCDVIIVGRGGGSIEDLWAFNDERVVRAVAACKTPIVSAVGHETDTTLSDFAADLRAPTPSAAAEVVTAHHAETARRAVELDRALRRAMIAKLELHRTRLSSITGSWGFRRPVDQLTGAIQRLDDLSERMGRAFRQQESARRDLLAQLAERLKRVDPKTAWLPRIEHQRELMGQLESRMKRAMLTGISDRRHRMLAAARQLNALGPPSVLNRGYSIISDMKGRKIYTGPDQTKPGQTLRVQSKGGSWKVAALPPEDELFDEV